MGIARQQRGADLPLKIIDSSAHDVDRQVEPLGRRSEAAATDHFQKNPRYVPIRETAESGFAAFLLRNAPFQRQTHTPSFQRAKLRRISGGLQSWRVHLRGF